MICDFVSPWGVFAHAGLVKSYALKTGSVCEQAEAFLVFQTVKAFLDFIASEPNTPRLQQALALWQALSSAL